MRKTARVALVWTFLVTFSAAGVTALAEEAPAGQNTMTTSAGPHHSFSLGVEPLWLLIGGLGAKADARLTDRVSLVLDGMYVPPRTATEDQVNQADGNNYKWSTYEVFLGPMFRLSGDYNHSGAYVMPAVGYAGAKISDYSFLKLSGAVDTWEARGTAGYEWVMPTGFRFTLGGGLRLLGAKDVVVKDNTGTEVTREKMDSTGALALDLQLSYMF